LAPSGDQPQAPPPAALRPAPDDRVRGILTALDGVCERTWVLGESGPAVGCRECPRAGAPVTEAVGDTDPALVITSRFDARLLADGSSGEVLTYSGCQPGIFGYGGTLLVDRKSRRRLRDDPGLDLVHCGAAARGAREVLVCIARREGYKMAAGMTHYSIGVYDPVDLRAVDPEGIDSAAWHPTSLFASTASLRCMSGTPPGELVTYGDIDALTVDDEPGKTRVRVAGTFAKQSGSHKAYLAACETHTKSSELGAALGAKPFTLEFTLRDGRLAPTAATSAWIAKAGVTEPAAP